MTTSNQKPSSTRTALSIIVIFICSQLFPQLISLLVAKLSSDPSILTPVSIYGTLIFALLASLCILWVDKKDNFQTATDASSSDFRQVIFWSVAGFFFLVIGQNLAGWIEVHLLGQSIQSQNTNLLVDIVQAYPLTAIYMCLLAPINEEFVFRKAIYASLTPHIGKVGAAVISGLLFALIHNDGHLLLYSVTAFILSFIYDRTHSIWAPIISHALLNLFALIVNLQ